jgi:FkbM family methyltransferase
LNQDKEIQRIFSRFYSRIQTSYRWRIWKPKPPNPVKIQLPLVIFGSKYGRKAFFDIYGKSQPITVLSGGVGEDISFDLELVAKYNARVILVDPSSPAISHIENLSKHFGQPAKTVYSLGSRQPIDAYDLSKVNEKHISFIAKALWNFTGVITFYPPKDPNRDSSGSINSIHTFYKRSDYFVEVPCTTILEIMKSMNIVYIDLMKLDIEGAALEVIDSMLADKIFPKQLIVEFDEMHFPSFKSRLRSFILFNKLKKNGYVLGHQDSCDFTFIRNDLLNES